MIEYSSSVPKTTKKKSKQFSGNFLPDFALLCSFVLSHPLYFSYFIFFSPYLLKLFAFLSPLFFTTFLLLLSLLTSFLDDSISISGLLENLQLRFEKVTDEEEEDSKELEGFEEFELYKIVFGSSAFDPDGETLPHGAFYNFESSEENPDEYSLGIEEESCGAPTFGTMEQNPGEEKEEKVLGVLISEEKENPLEFSGEIEGKFCGIPITDQLGENPVAEEVLEEEKILGVLISDEWEFPAKGENLDEHSVQEESQSEKLTTGADKAGEMDPKTADKKCGEVLTVANCNLLELTPSSINGRNHTQKRRQMKTHSRRHGEAVWETNDENSTIKKHDDDDDDDYLFYSSPQSQPISPSLSNLGSMRKEKEWRRTLACKLFEERHNSVGGGGGGGEEMDLLWEAYEKTDDNKGKLSRSLRKKGKEKKKKKHVLDYGDSDEEEEEDEEGDNGQLCCLQALKFSAAKMNFGMGKPGFLKISKAFKGIGGGWLNHHHHHQSSGGSRKGKNY